MTPSAQTNYDEQTNLVPSSIESSITPSVEPSLPRDFATLYFSQIFNNTYVAGDALNFDSKIMEGDLSEIANNYLGIENLSAVVLDIAINTMNLIKDEPSCSIYNDSSEATPSCYQYIYINYYANDFMNDLNLLVTAVDINDPILFILNDVINQVLFLQGTMQ